MNLSLLDYNILTYDILNVLNQSNYQSNRKIIHLVSNGCHFSEVPVGNSMHVPNVTLQWPDGHPTFQSCVVGEEPINTFNWWPKWILLICSNWNRKWCLCSLPYILKLDNRYNRTPFKGAINITMHVTYLSECERHWSDS